MKFDNRKNPQTDLRFAIKHYFLLFIPAWLFLCVILWMFFQTESAFDRRSFERDISHTLNLQAESIHIDFVSIISDLKFISRFEEIPRFVEWSGTQGKEHFYEEIIAMLEAKGFYDPFRLINAAGMETTRVNYNNGKSAAVPRKQLQDKSHRYYVRESLRMGRDEVYVSPFDLNMEHGEITYPLKPTIRFATPVFNEQRQKKGIVIINFSGKRLLDNLNRIAALPTDGFMLVNKDGYWLKGRTPQEEWGFMFEDRKNETFGQDFPREWKWISQNTSGRFYTKNGLFVFRTVSPMADRGNESYYWKLISHVSVPVLAGLSQQIFNRFLIIYGFMTILLLAGCVFLTRARVDRKRVERVMKTLPRKIIQAQEEERDNISREIHDDIGQSLVTLKILVQASGPEPKEGEPAGHSESYKKIIEYLNTIIEKTRDLASLLHPSTLEVLGLSTTLETMINDFRKKRGLHIQFTACKLDHLVFKGEVINLYRIVQEAMTNIVKHARASEVRITFKRTENSLHVTIEDNGQGFKFKRDRRRLIRGIGLSTMAERVRLLGGVFDVKSLPDEGTTVTLTVPVEVEER